MDGKRLRIWLEANKIKVYKAAEKAGLSRQTLTTYLNAAELSTQQREILQEGLDLPENFFTGPVQFAGDNATQTQTFSSVAECEKDLAVAQETIRQLEIRIKEKDTIINNLLKSQTSKK